MCAGEKGNEFLLVSKINMMYEMVDHHDSKHMCVSIIDFGLNNNGMRNCAVLNVAVLMSNLIRTLGFVKQLVLNLLNLFSRVYLSFRQKIFIPLI